MSLSWTCERLDDLSPRALYEALALRSAVFVVEQQCVFLDPDSVDLDRQVWHLLGHVENQDLQVYARILAPLTKGVSQINPVIGRVVTSPSARGNGQGRALMLQAIAECEKRWPGQPIDIQAQAYLLKFYASLGFEPVSAPYDEDGISHVDMRKHPSHE